MSAGPAMPEISVIIPAFRPAGFEALTRSIGANREVKAEWIVVDDGSGPDYDAVFATLPEDVRLIRLPDNRRQGAARNAGLVQARGAWIKFLDADDRLNEGHLSALLEAAQPGGAIPFAPTSHVFAGGAGMVNDSWRDLPEEPQAQFRRQLVRPFLHHCGALFPLNLLTRLGGYDETLITDEDGDLLLRVLLAGHHFVAVPQVQYLYVHHTDGPRVSTDDGIAKMQARIRVCDKIEAALGPDMPPETAQALAQRMDRIAMTYWTAHRAEAQALLARARALSPGYRPDMRAPLRFLRRIGGPGLVFAAQASYRRLKGRPKGGAQG